MSEEPQVLSIQDRIRALKQAQTGQGSEGTGSPSLGSQPTAFALRSASSQSNGSNNNNNNNNNNSTVPIQPPPYSKEPPPPVPRISHAGVTPSDITTGAARQQPKRPPPLPARKSSSQQLAAPSLPPRRPSVDSVASDASRSTNTSTSALSASTTTTGRPSSKPTTPGSVVKAPPWGATELPPLPPKRQNTQPAVSSTVSRPKPKTVASSNGRLPVPPPRPSLPARRSSNQSASTVSTESSITSSQSRQPPPLPRRNTRDKSPGPLACEDTNPPPQPKRLPPPLPSGNALDKIRGSGFGGLSKKVQDINGTSSPAQDAGSAGTPPPVPVGSRPDLSAIMATKPRVAASNGAVTNGAPPPAAIVAAACMICRDFTAPDTHAARYPRQTLPTQDIGWLARELTAPFLSATDKARAIFTWLHHNIDYDTVSFYNNCVKPSTPSSTLASGLAVCEGYAGLFAALAKEAGLEARVVSGHGKGAGYESPAPGAPLPPFSPSGHAWNVVRIDNGHWKLIDPCWGAGHTTGPNMPYVRSFNPSMFTMTNDEFGLKHFPQDKAHLYRDDGRREISWEEYILGDPNSPLCAEQPRTFSDAKKHSIGERSFRPASQKISIRQTGPLRFQFNLFCEHWSLQRHSRAKPGLFLLMIHGVDGRKDERLPFAHWRPSGSDGGGDVWYVDVADARALGAPGQKVQLAVLTKLGQREDARGVTVEEYQRQVGKVGMAWAYIAEWELVV